MTRFTFFIMSAMSLISIGCGYPTQQPPSSTRNSVPAAVELQPSGTPSRLAAVRLDVQTIGVHEQTIQRDDGTVLRFTISIPNTYSEQMQSPLVVALHYGGEVTPFYGRGMIDGIVGPALEDLHAIVVAPDSIAGDWTDPTNEAAVFQIMDSVIASYNVDKSKTLLTGYSMGGKAIPWINNVWK